MWRGGGGVLMLGLNIFFLNWEPKYRRIVCLTLHNIAKKPLLKELRIAWLLLEIIAISKIYLAEDFPYKVESVAPSVKLIGISL
jgi:hypothetical protein